MTNILQQIKDAYNINGKELIPAPRGFVAETYLIEDKFIKYFVKIIKKGRFTENIIQSLPVLDELSKLPNTKINFPYKTLYGGYHIEFDSKVLVLFNYIEGKTFLPDKLTFTIENNLYEGISNIHFNTSKVTTHIKNEQFELTMKNELEFNMKILFNTVLHDPIQKDLKTLITIYKDEILNDWETAQRIALECKQKSPSEFVLTHGDFIGNNLVTKDQDVYIIDWDDILLAPRERDTWFLFDNKLKWDSFTKLYTKYFPNYQLNAAYYKFYLYQRYFADMTDWINNILGNELGQKEKQQQFLELKSDCFEDWLRPLIRNSNN